MNIYTYECMYRKRGENLSDSIDSHDLGILELQRTTFNKLETQMSK